MFTGSKNKHHLVKCYACDCYVVLNEQESFDADYDNRKQELYINVHISEKGVAIVFSADVY